MSLAMSSMTGMVRRARKMPLTLRVSPMLVSTPYFLGIRMSCCHTSTPPARMVQRTASAPLRASLRFMRGHNLGRIVAAVDDALHRLARKLQPLLVDVHQDERCILQQRERENVPDQSARETQTACADERDACHSSSPQSIDDKKLRRAGAAHVQAGRRVCRAATEWRSGKIAESSTGTDARANVPAARMPSKARENAAFVPTKSITCLYIPSRATASARARLPSRTV